VRGAGHAIAAEPQRGCNECEAACFAGVVALEVLAVLHSAHDTAPPQAAVADDCHLCRARLLLDTQTKSLKGGVRLRGCWVLTMSVPALNATRRDGSTRVARNARMHDIGCRRRDSAASHTCEHRFAMMLRGHTLQHIHSRAISCIDKRDDRSNASLHVCCVHATPDMCSSMRMHARVWVQW